MRLCPSYIMLNAKSTKHVQLPCLFLTSTELNSLSVQVFANSLLTPVCADLNSVGSPGDSRPCVTAHSIGRGHVLKI